MGRSPCCEKVGLKKGPWTPEEDQKLVAYIEQHGHGSWRALPAKAGLQRCGKSCRLRWTNYLRPDIKRGKFSLQEEQTIIQLHALLGNRWSAIAAQLPKRTDNEIKNYWNTHLKKRLTRMGIDPTTHRPKTDALGSSSDSSSTSHSKDASNLSHMAQWESARLEAEARLVRESKLQLQTHQQQQQSTHHHPPARLVLNKITTHQPSFPPCLDVLKAWQNSWSSKPFPSSSTTKDNNNNSKIHSMYAMMLSTDDSLLESPTSTLCFPGSNNSSSIMLPMVSTTTTTTTVGVVNENNNNLLITPLTNIANNGTMKGGNNSNSTTTTTTTGSDESSSWGYMMTKHIPQDAEHGRDDEKIIMEKGASLDNNSSNNNNNNNQLRDDDDIMVAVEAFRSGSSAGGVGAYDNNVGVTVTRSEVVADGLNNESMVYDSNQDSLAIINGEGGICNVSLEEENKHYWNAILNLVNDAQLMF